jgi:hypothetical protein
MLPMPVMITVQIERQGGVVDTYHKLKIVRQSYSAATRRERGRTYPGVGVLVEVQVEPLGVWLLHNGDSGFRMHVTRATSK